VPPDAEWKIFRCKSPEAFSQQGITADARHVEQRRLTHDAPIQTIDDIQQFQGSEADQVRLPGQLVLQRRGLPGRSLIGMNMVPVSVDQLEL
jgi:hypothetical protein